MCLSVVTGVLTLSRAYHCPTYCGSSSKPKVLIPWAPAPQVRRCKWLWCLHRLCRRMSALYRRSWPLCMRRCSPVGPGPGIWCACACFSFTSSACLTHQSSKRNASLNYLEPKCDGDKYRIGQIVATVTVIMCILERLTDEP